MITDEDGEVVARYEYDAYGKVISVVEEPAVADFPMRFVGAEGVRFDGLCGLYYMRARWYSPQLGRFLSKDPVHSVTIVNSYKYCSNPTNSIDPTGLYAWLLVPVLNFVVENYALILAIEGSVIAGAEIRAFTRENPEDLSSIAGDAAFGAVFYKALGGLMCLMHEAEYGEALTTLRNWRSERNPPVGWGRTTAIEVGEVNGTKLMEFAVSGENALHGIPVPERIYLPPKRPTGNPGLSDAERKLMETRLAQTLLVNPGAPKAGNLKYVADKMPCPTCEELAQYLQKMYPGIKIRIAGPHPKPITLEGAKLFGTVVGGSRQK